MRFLPKFGSPAQQAAIMQQAEQDYGMGGPKPQQASPAAAIPAPNAMPKPGAVQSGALPLSPEQGQAFGQQIGPMFGGMGDKLPKPRHYGGTSPRQQDLMRNLFEGGRDPRRDPEPVYDRHSLLSALGQALAGRR